MLNTTQQNMKKTSQRSSTRQWFASGDPWIWLTASSVAISLILVLGMLWLIAARGLPHFWPHAVVQFQVQTQTGEREIVLGQRADEEVLTPALFAEAEVTPADRYQTLEYQQGKKAIPTTRLLIKTANRDLTGQDFRWLYSARIMAESHPEDIMVIERQEWGSLFAYLQELTVDGRQVATVADKAKLQQAFFSSLKRANGLREQISVLEKHKIGAINAALEKLRLKHRRLELKDKLSPAAVADINQAREGLQTRYKKLEQQLGDLYQKLSRDEAIFLTAQGKTTTVAFQSILQGWQPNAMSFLQKVGHYFKFAWLFVSDDPREANTEGGIFPAIFGTVMMVLLMSLLVTPFGVMAAVYMHEYAHQGWLTRIIRIAVNNLAGVPSIVYGVFGLGFFVYGLGGKIDEIFFPESLPNPTFGTGGLFWAALTLALLTLPVVIVSTEEGLSRIPKAIREGSLALGATPWETLWRTILPMASPGIMTGMILAVARAAGEVAPLMLVGVVKLAPTLPVDGIFPYMHLDRKFMHLGFHIYDVGFQSPNVEAARPLVYATALLLVIVIVLLNLFAIRVRNRLREKYRLLEN